MGFFYHEPFLRCYEEGIVKFEIEHDKWNKLGSAASDVHVHNYLDGDVVYRDQQSMQKREAWREYLGRDSKTYT